MDIRTLLTRVDVIENNQLSLKKYLSESLYNTPEMQSHWKRIDEGFVRGYEKYLAEVALTPEQIQSIFKQASGGAASGEAPKEPGKLAALVDKVLPADQAGALEKTLPEPNAGPVQGFEQKAAAAVQNIQGADQATKQSLMQWIKQGVAKPETQQLILAAVGAGVGSLISKVGPILSMIPGGGPVAAAVTGAVIAGAVSVASAKLQGKDWKTAFKGAIKPALMGGASAVIGNLATTAIGAMTGGGDSAQQGAGGEGSPEQQKAIADDQARMDSFQQKFPPGEGYTYQGQGDRLQVFDANGNKVFSGDIPFKSMDASTFAGLAQNGQNVSSMTNQGASVSSDPTAGVSDGSGKRGDSGWNSMKANTNPDGSPMTLDQINQAKDNLRAGNATDMSGPTDAPAGVTPRPSMLQPLNNLDGSERPGAADANAAASNQGRLKLDQWRTDTGSPNAPAPTSDEPSIQPRGGYGAQEKINAMMQAKADAEYAAQQGTPSDASASNQGRLKMNQWRQDVGSPNAIGSNFDAGIAPLGPDGTPMQAVPMDAPATPQGINRLTGRAHVDPANWNTMTPDQQAATVAKQQQQAADAAAGTQNAQNYWANKAANTRGLKESFAESKYVDKQATLRKWLVQESRGQRVHGLALKPTIKEGIMDSIKGMFGGGKKGDAPAAGGVTADALNKAWAAAGSPTDSEEVAKVLQSAGVPAETVSKVFADLKLPEPTGQVEPKMDPEQTATAEPTAPETPATEPTAPETPATEPEKGAEEPATTTPAAGGVNIDDLVARINKLAPADKEQIIAALQG